MEGRLSVEHRITSTVKLLDGELKVFYELIIKCLSKGWSWTELTSASEDEREEQFSLNAEEYRLLISLQNAIEQSNALEVKTT